MIHFLFKLVPFQRTWLFFGGYDSIEESRKKQSQPGFLVATTHDSHNLHKILAPNAAHLPFRERESSKKSRVCSGNYHRPGHGNRRVKLLPKRCAEQILSKRLGKSGPSEASNFTLVKDYVVEVECRWIVDLRFS